MYRCTPGRADSARCVHRRHQATVYACTSPDPQAAAVRWRLFGGSVTMILFQLSAAIGAMRNTQAVSCSSNEQCEIDGMYCEVFSSGEGLDKSQSNRCSYCLWPPDARAAADERGDWRDLEPRGGCTWGG